ncbi:MAG: glycosyltransferase family 2 protein [bacterium]
MDNIVLKCKSPLVSILILHHSKSKTAFKYLVNCLKSLEKSTYRNFEVILFDQSPTSVVANYISRHFSHVKVIKIKKNLGAAEGRNQAAKFAHGDYQVFLDYDTKPEPEWLEELVKAVQCSRPNVAVFGSFEAPYNERVKNGGVHGTCDILGCTYGEKENKHQIDPRYFHFEVLEAALLVKRGVFETIGGFDPRYWILCEGLDLCWRARLAGYDIVHVRSAVYHHAGLSTKHLSRKSVYFTERNTLMTLIKNYSLKTLTFILPLSILQLMLEVFIFAFSGKPDLAFAVIRAILWNFKHLKENWIWHLKTQRLRRVSDKAIMNKMLKKNVKALKTIRYLGV